MADAINSNDQIIKGVKSPQFICEFVFSNNL